MAITDGIKVIDADSHLTETADLWTARVSTKRWGDMVPHVIRNPNGPRDERGRLMEDIWVFGDDVVMETGRVSVAGWKDGHFPDHPLTLDEVWPPCYDARERVRYLDSEGIHAQLLYPNVGGFTGGRFSRIGDPELRLECVRAYNDYQADWVREAPDRLIPVAAMPFWDVDACVAEIRRCAGLGHRGVLWGSHTETYGLPWLPDPHWDPVWAAAQDAGLPINFHIGSANDQQRTRPWDGYGPHTAIARATVGGMQDNAFTLADLVFGGICERFPDVDFALVESGVGWLPFTLEMMDWNFHNVGVPQERPDLKLLPSEYFRRQISVTFWFEQESALSVLERFPDNIMYETDFPHPQSMSPGGPPGVGGHPHDYIERTLGHLPRETLRKLLHDNAARVYHLDG